jgi:hypothetical protein
VTTGIARTRHTDGAAVSGACRQGENLEQGSSKRFGRKRVILPLTVTL